MEKEKLNLYQKLHRIQCQVMGLGKDKDGQNFKYVSGAKVLDAIKPIMKELGLILKQEIISIDNVRQDYQTSLSQDKETKVWTGKPKSEILSKVMMKFTWVDVETGEKDENLFGANGQNDWDKGVGSAMTYAERYFLLKFFHIATDEDDIDNPKVDELIEEVKICKTTDVLSKIWADNVTLQAEAKFKQAVISRKKQIENESK
jgi:hypothetical protein